MKQKIFLAGIAFALLTACTSKKPITATPGSERSLVADGKLYASVWQQRAAEYKALSLQAYNIATLRLNQILQEEPGGTPKAVVTDIDETLLDNSPNAVKQAIQGKDYEEKSWREWTAKGIADTLWGARNFFTYAASRGVEVFYITNRAEAERAGTLKNLQRYGFPFADSAHLILRNGPSSKETRRQQVAGKYNIVLLCGDNLADFSSLFDHKTEEERTAAVATLAAQFGNRFIVLPNPVYGDWESSLFQYNFQLQPQQKDSIYLHDAKGE